LLRFGQTGDGEMARIDTRFIDSPDAMCHRSFRAVNSRCRVVAIATVSQRSTVLLRLPYLKLFHRLAEGPTLRREGEGVQTLTRQYQREAVPILSS
jgi:hypothetical protein